VDGKCVFACATGRADGGVQTFRDCNGSLDDGCETDILTDAKHCGLCGHACDPGEHCISGHCGCFSPLSDCGGLCVDTRSSDSNCGACGNVCQKPAVGCNPMPPFTAYGCLESQCGQLKCRSGAGDCNDDLDEGCASDGCETPLNTNENCGACGHACGPGQECRFVQGAMKCEDTCQKLGLVECGATDETPGVCSDLVTDKFNCGLCGVRCEENASLHTEGACKHGLCVTACAPGFADCNGDATDGCEVDLNSQPASCGACGNRCDLDAGQPCIEGKCLMVECDAGVVTK